MRVFCLTLVVMLCVIEELADLSGPLRVRACRECGLGPRSAENSDDGSVHTSIATHCTFPCAT